MRPRRTFIKQSLLGAAAILADYLNASSSIMDLTIPSSDEINHQDMKLATVSWTFGLEDLDELFKEVTKLGFKYLQYCGDFKKYKASTVLEKASQYGVHLASYDPIDCKPENKEQATLNNSITFYKQIIDYASDLKVPMVTLQGLSFWTTDDQTYDEAFTQITKAVRELSLYAKSKNILTTYEAVCHYETPWIHTSTELLRIKRESRADNLQLVLDSFHMNITESDMITPIYDVGKNFLYSYHVSDSGRGGMGTGHINFKDQYKALKQIGFNGLVCFEIVTPEVRPYKLPMNDSQFKKFIKQNQQSLKAWKMFS